MLLTVPVFYPLVQHLGFDLIWFRDHRRRRDGDQLHHAAGGQTSSSLRGLLPDVSIRDVPRRRAVRRGPTSSACSPHRVSSRCFRATSGSGVATARAPAARRAMAGAAACLRPEPASSACRARRTTARSRTTGSIPSPAASRACRSPCAAATPRVLQRDQRGRHVRLVGVDVQARAKRSCLLQPCRAPLRRPRCRARR